MCDTDIRRVLGDREDEGDDGWDRVLDLAGFGEYVWFLAVYTGQHQWV